MDDTLTADEAAAILGYHPDYVRRLLRDGTIKAQQFNRFWMIHQEEVDRIKALQ
jgi:excisionase family DNA binding protein